MLNSNFNDHSCLSYFPMSVKVAQTGSCPGSAFRDFGNFLTSAYFFTFLWPLDKAKAGLSHHLAWLIIVSSHFLKQYLLSGMIPFSWYFLWVQYSPPALLDKSYLFIKTQCKTTFLVKSVLFKVHIIFYYRMELAFLGLGANELVC